MKRWYLLFLFCNVVNIGFAISLNIKSFGAKSDGKTLNTKAVQTAIDSCARTGGGEVLIPAGGVYVTGTIFLKTNVFLRLESGATLQGSPRMADYDKKFPHLIVAERAENTGIFGNGVIDGNGAAFWDANFLPKERPEPWLIFFYCKKLKFENVQLLNSPAHVLVLDHCEEVVVNAVRIVNHLQSPNTDGIDVTDSRNVFITHCYIETGDDGICLKSHDLMIENVIATSNIIISDDAAIKFGTGGAVGVRYCTFSNNIIRNSRYGIALFQMDGGRYEHCQFTNTVIQTGSRHKTEYPIFIDIDKRRDTSKIGSISNLHFSNIQIRTRGNCLIAGQIQSNLQNLTFDNITLTAAPEPATDLRQAHKPRGNKTLLYYPDMQDFAPMNAWFTFGNVNGLTLRNVIIQDDTKSREGFYFEGVKRKE